MLRAKMQALRLSQCIFGSAYTYISSAYSLMDFDILR